MAVAGALSALLRYRRLRFGIRVDPHSVTRRWAWPRVVLGQAKWAMLCALLITQIPWTQRTVPHAFFRVGKDSGGQGAAAGTGSDEIGGGRDGVHRCRSTDGLRGRSTGRPTPCRGHVRPGFRRPAGP
ncbi:hypothetical protein [Streptomyces sp. NPDC005989]|uniref:hypothetical protein n=1 Tax=Streptomyces sp. NPDC005989 TaxID=3156727 RepID=UPI0033DCBDFD